MLNRLWHLHLRMSHLILLYKCCPSHHGKLWMWLGTSLIFQLAHSILACKILFRVNCWNLLLLKCSLSSTNNVSLRVWCRLRTTSHHLIVVLMKKSTSLIYVDLRLRTLSIVSLLHALTIFNWSKSLPTLHIVPRSSSGRYFLGIWLLLHRFLTLMMPSVCLVHLTFFTFRNCSTLIFLKSCLLFEIAKIVLTPSFLMSLELLIFQIIKEIININPI